MTLASRWRSWLGIFRNEYLDDGKGVGCEMRIDQADFDDRPDSSLNEKRLRV
jgi:hypothetical protein